MDRRTFIKAGAAAVGTSALAACETVSNVTSGVNIGNTPITVWNEDLRNSTFGFTALIGREPTALKKTIENGIALQGNRPIVIDFQAWDPNGDAHGKPTKISVASFQDFKKALTTQVGNVPPFYSVTFSRHGDTNTALNGEATKRKDPTLADTSVDTGLAAVTKQQFQGIKQRIKAPAPQPN
jgi:hypothetical protein